MAVIGSLCCIAVQIDWPSSQARAHWRTNVARTYRRHPRLVLTTVASLTVAVACWFAIVVIELT